MGYFKQRHKLLLRGWLEGHSILVLRDFHQKEKRAQTFHTCNWKYRVCRGFRLLKRDDFCWVDFDLFCLLNQALFLEAPGTVLKIGSSLKLNRHQEI